MHLKQLNIFEFDNFVLNNPLGNYHQSSSYALYASEQGYDYDLLGFVDNDNNIHAATLIISKKLGMFKRYGYAPKGFIIDYYNEELLENFLNALKKYYYRKNFAFIKINPEIAIGTVDYQNKKVNYNQNIKINTILKKHNFRSFEGIKHFETKIPKYNAIQLLKKTNINTVSKNTRNKIHKSIRNGLSFEKGTRDDIKILYEFIKNKKKHSINHYYNYYNAFSKNDNIDIFLVKIDFEECLINLRQQYEEEYRKNNLITEKTMNNPKSKFLHKKLISDNLLNSIKENITIVTRYLAENKTTYIAGAITIKYKNRVYILISGIDQKYKQFCPNYFLHYQLIEYYKDDYDFMDLNGITGDFNFTNPYKGLDKFKLGFNPLTYEYIGEYDFIINEGLYSIMEKSGLLAQEFTRQQKSINN